MKEVGAVMQGKSCQKGALEPHSEEGLAKVLALIIKTMAQVLGKFLERYFRVT